jgi:Crinkler effector protein N-terminal domain
MAPKPKKYELFCLIVDEDNPFSVEIKSTATVDKLKKAIKTEKQPALDHIAANELNLFKVKIPMGDKIQIEEGITALQQATAMSPGSQLNKCFPARLSNDTIYVLVQLPVTGK